MELEFHNINHIIADKNGNPEKILKMFRKFIDIINYTDKDVRYYIFDNKFDLVDNSPPPFNWLINGKVEFSGEKEKFVDFITFEYDKKGKIINEKFTNIIEWKILANYIIKKYHLSMLDYFVKETYNKIVSDINKTTSTLNKYKKCIENQTISDNWIQQEIEKLGDFTPEEIQNDIKEIDKWIDIIIKLKQDLRK